MLRAFITGVAGTVLTAEERALLSHARPCGLILFSRNCVALDQIRTLVADVTDAVGSEILVLIDQEGGRVQRLRPPLGRSLPPAAAFADLYDQQPERACEAAFAISRLVAHDLKVLGINTNCTPVLDLPTPEAHEIIGDRAFGADPTKVAKLGRAIADGYLAGGVLPVIKHIPGHGRAGEDSHLKRPVVNAPRDVLERSDFKPFNSLRDLPLAMTAHVVFTALDAGQPASTSPIVIKDVIRDWIGFDGLLMSDDVSMKALGGSLAERARAVLAAGTDVVLHCNGNLAEMRDVAREAPELSGPSLKRFQAALTMVGHTEPLDHGRAEGLLEALLTTPRTTSESV
ncbi:MAG: beta-N-acetylhexosaminidase [Alphaproteobacteria bacterium]|nr:beta-N-acetylhexosaminidase [Alphaproteobacteria bacterium]